MFKRIVCWTATLFLLMPVTAEAVGTSAVSAILVDADSGRVLYQQNADKKMLIASTTKIMTALVAIQEGTLSDVVTVSSHAAGTEGSSMYLREGEQLTLETLLYGLMLCSGNDAAVAIAEHVGGSVPGFVKKMNEMAVQLGMKSSSFANPNGLDDERHYSTARDMAVLAQAALKNETFVRIVSTKSVTIGNRTMANHNKLLRYIEGCIGLKTGYTRAAGRTLVSCVEKNGQRLIAVTLKDGNDWVDHKNLYDYGFHTYPSCSAAVLGQVLEYAPVLGGTAATMPLVAAESFSWPLSVGERLEGHLHLNTPLSAPLYAGKTVGEMRYSINGKEVGKIGILCGKTVLPQPVSAMGSLKMKLPK